MSKEIRLGDMVQTAVFVGAERVPMATGRVVAIRNGSCDIDIMSHHGGAPWIVSKPTHSLEKVTEVVRGE